MDQTFNALIKHFGKMPYIHGMRMLGQCDGDYPLASADSTNVAQNFKRYIGCAECMTRPIDARQPAAKWKTREVQQPMFIDE